MTATPDLVARLEEVLAAGGVVNARQEALWLVESATGAGRADLLRGEARFSRTDESRAVALAHRRAAGEPLQYVTETAGFRTLELRVGPGVFIPRPETELVAERAMELLPRHGSVVDVGTGSGAIALSVATERPDAHVYATESSTRALAYATENARRCGATVEFFSCDLLGGLPQRLTGAVDVVVSNPPYVPLGERALLAPDVVAHEPHDALFSGEGGLEQISRLARDARRWLRPGGWLVVEIGDRQGAAVRALLTTEDYGDVRVARDYSGRERIATARA